MAQEAFVSNEWIHYVCMLPSILSSGTVDTKYLEATNLMGSY
ncbi:hypothetical protein [Erysipelothrix anatis]|nr:hypothetical protein [Erysipelothrix anatis]